MQRPRGLPRSVFETRLLRVIFSFVRHPSDLFAAIRAFPVDILPIGYPSLLTMANVIGDNQVAAILPIDHPRLDAQDIARGVEVLPLLGFFSPAGTCIARQKVLHVDAPDCALPVSTPSRAGDAGSASCLVQTTTVLLGDVLGVMLPHLMAVSPYHVIEISGRIAINEAATIWMLGAFELSRRVNSLHVFKLFSPMATECPLRSSRPSRASSAHCVDLRHFELPPAWSLRTSNGLRDLEIMGSLDFEALQCDVAQAAGVYGLAPTRCPQ